MFSHEPGVFNITVAFSLTFAKVTLAHVLLQSKNHWDYSFFTAGQFFGRKICWLVSTIPNEFFRTIHAHIHAQDSWRRQQLYQFLVFSGTCIHDLKFFAMPKSFHADLTKQLMAFAEYDNNSNNNNNNNNNLL